MARRAQTRDNSDWNEYRKVDNKRNKNKNQTRNNNRKQKLSEKKNFLS